MFFGWTCLCSLLIYLHLIPGEICTNVVFKIIPLGLDSASDLYKLFIYLYVCVT